MTSSAVIFDLKLKPPMVSKFNHLGCSFKNVMRFGKNLVLIDFELILPISNTFDPKTIDQDLFPINLTVNF